MSGGPPGTPARPDNAACVRVYRRQPAAPASSLSVSRQASPAAQPASSDCAVGIDSVPDAVGEFLRGRPLEGAFLSDRSGIERYGRFNVSESSFREGDATAEPPEESVVDLPFGSAAAIPFRLCNHFMEPPVAESHDRVTRRRMPRAVVAGAMLVAVFALIAFSVFRRPQRQAELIERIKAAGGFVSHEPPASLQERLSAFKAGTEWDHGYTSVRLYASDITGEWLREQGELKALSITHLKLAETSLTDADLARLIRAHPLQVVEFRDEQMGDEAAAALADCRRLFSLEIRDAPLTDAQLARLPLEQFEELRIDGSLVTVEGLQELRRAQRLHVLALDGRQLDASTAQMLSQLPALKSLELVGESVTDEQVSHLRGLTSLEWISLRRTAATRESVESLESMLPNCEVRMR